MYSRVVDQSGKAVYEASMLCRNLMVRGSDMEF